MPRLPEVTPIKAMDKKVRSILRLRVRRETMKLKRNLFVQLKSHDAGGHPRDDGYPAYRMSRL